MPFVSFSVRLNKNKTMFLTTLIYITAKIIKYKAAAAATLKGAEPPEPMIIKYVISH